MWLNLACKVTCHSLFLLLLSLSRKSSTSLLLPPKAILVPSDWIFFPIVLEYDRTLIVAKKYGDIKGCPWY